MNRHDGHVTLRTFVRINKKRMCFFLLNIIRDYTEMIDKCTVCKCVRCARTTLNNHNLYSPPVFSVFLRGILYPRNNLTQNPQRC